MKVKSSYLAELIMKRGESQCALAKRAGVSRQTIGVMMAGSRVPSIDKLMAVARALDVTVDDIIDYDEEKAPLIRNTQVLRDLILDTMEKKGITTVESLCKLVGYDNVEVATQLLSGRKSWFPEFLSAILDALEITDPPLSPREKALLLPSGSFKKDGAMLLRPIPVATWANAASSIQASLSSDGCVMENFDENTETVLVPIGNRSISQAFAVSGASMEPTMYDDDIIIVEHKENFEAINDRKVVVVKFSDNFPGTPGVVCKRIRRSGDIIRLTSDNPMGEEFEITPKNKEFVEWVGQVVQIQSNRGL